jgi:hypothetical protein
MGSPRSTRSRRKFAKIRRHVRLSVCRNKSEAGLLFFAIQRVTGIVHLDILQKRLFLSVLTYFAQKLLLQQDGCSPHYDVLNFLNETATG